MPVATTPYPQRLAALFPEPAGPAVGQAVTPGQPLRSGFQFALFPWACYVSRGARGYPELRRLIEAARQTSPGALLIADGKWGDVGATAAKYAQAVFDDLGFDAATVNVWGGLGDSLSPWLERPDRGAFVWLRHDRPGAADLMRRRLRSGTPLYEHMAEELAARQHPNVGLMADPGAAPTLRAAARELPLLIDGGGGDGRYAMLRPGDGRTERPGQPGGPAD